MTRGPYMGSQGISPERNSISGKPGDIHHLWQGPALHILRRESYHAHPSGLPTPSPFSQAPIRDNCDLHWCALRVWRRRGPWCEDPVWPTWVCWDPPIWKMVPFRKRSQDHTCRGNCLLMGRRDVKLQGQDSTSVTQSITFILKISWFFCTLVSKAWLHPRQRVEPHIVQ